MQDGDEDALQGQLAEARGRLAAERHHVAALQAERSALQQRLASAPAAATGDAAAQQAQVPACCSRDFPTLLARAEMFGAQPGRLLAVSPGLGGGEVKEARVPGEKLLCIRLHLDAVPPLCNAMQCNSTCTVQKPSQRASMCW